VRGDVELQLGRTDYVLSCEIAGSLYNSGYSVYVIINFPFSIVKASFYVHFFRLNNYRKKGKTTINQ
jgi:hypothetical protein